MKCYRDRSWCYDSTVCTQQNCDIKITDAHIQKSHDLNIPISWINAKDSDLCVGYEPVIKHLDQDYQD